MTEESSPTVYQDRALWFLGLGLFLCLGGLTSLMILGVYRVPVDWAPVQGLAATLKEFGLMLLGALINQLRVSR